MGQIISWFRGSNPRDEPGLRDVSVVESESGTTPKPTAPVSHFEQKPSAGSNMASKPTAARSDVTATGSVSKTNPGPDVTLFSPKGWSKSGASAQAKSSSSSASETKVAPKTTTLATTVKAGEAETTKPSTTTTTTTARPTSTTTTTTTTTTASKTPATKAQTTKVQVEVPSKVPATKQVCPPLDPLDALASSLPSEAPKRPEPKYTGPEVKEGVTSEKGVRVGEREDTLPPGYRLEDMGPVPADTKPAEVPKPMSTDDALDVLSSGFLSQSTPEKVETIGAASTAQTNFAAAPPPKKSESSAPPADKKAKLDVASDSFSLSAAVPAGKPSAAAPPKMAPSSKAQAPPVKAPSMDADALGALEDLLPTAEPPKPEAPLRPDQIVKEATVEEEEGVRVGEREDTLPPEYRFKAEDKNLPPPKPEPSLDTADALDFLSGDFSLSTAPTTQSAAPAPAQKPVSAPLDKKPRMEPDGFSLEAGLTSSSTQKVESAAVLPPKKSETKPTKSKEKPKDVTDSRPALDQGGSMSLDALSALEDLLPTAEPPKPEAPLRPDQIVKEATVEEEEGVRVGEREDTLPPEYRFKAEDKNLPPPKPEPSLDTTEALDFLSGDFSLSSAPSTQSAAPAPVAPVQADADAALDALSGDFMSSSSAPSTQTGLDALSGDFLAASAAPTVQSSACPPQAALDAEADFALDALSDSLKDINPTPQPEPPMPTKVVKEKKIEEERLIKMGERDDTLPPEYRPTEEDLKKMKEKSKVPESPKEAMDDAKALDLLAGDFSTPVAPSAPAAPSAPVSSVASAPVCSAPTDAKKPMASKVLDSLSDTLLPDKPESKNEKPKAKSKSRSRSKKPQAEGLPSSQHSSDIVPTSTKKS
ncbi:calpastatin isoform X6 [Periophthalmus magnuspinnatus]|uniref:calpastatin isoform X6 n=1 Tax=Periophthalmus magnuspinnatus TaxID=409849 RepID=UPI0024369E03|nr:calpastatin isoform X6 [Periophthalmus magnuspinnatus]